MLFFRPPASCLAQGLRSRKVLFIALHLEGRQALLVFEVTLLGHSGTVEGAMPSPIFVCSSHLTRGGFERTFFLRAKLLRESRFIPRIVLNCVNVLAGVLVAHCVSRAALGALHLAFLLALRLGANWPRVGIELALLEVSELGGGGSRVVQIFRKS